MKYAVLSIPMIALLASACTPPASTSNQAAGNAAAPSNATAPSNMPAGNGSAAATGPLSAYVGRLPSDAVNGVTFLANPQVRAAVEAAVTEAEVRRWVLREDVTSNPIGSRDGRIIATGCESHNCGPHHWSIVIDPAGTSAEVCYARNSTLERSTWYVAGRPAEERPGDCPASGG
ncbi:hypothetical protein [Sphingosinicella sp.]|uniref:hypothetical protein n=1 Tax=Sphingosinicella sp. TaxID=1917971 RepID=UPI00403808F6